LTVTLLVLAMAAFASQPGIAALGGSIGLLTAIAVWDAAASIVIASTRKR
jgi:succinate-acetate transporter protein